MTEVIKFKGRVKVETLTKILRGFVEHTHVVSITYTGKNILYQTDKHAFIAKPSCVGYYNVFIILGWV